MNKTRSCILHLLAVSLSITSLTLFSERALAQRDQDCKSIPKQVNDLVDKVAELSEKRGEVSASADASTEKGHEEARKKWLEARDSYQSAINKTKVAVDNLLGKFSPRSPDCKVTPKQINDLVDKVAELGEKQGEVTEKADESAQNGHEDARKKWLQARDSYQSAINKTKVNIDKLLTALSACCAKGTVETPPPTPQEKPTPYVVENFKPGEVFVGYQFQRAPDESAKNLNGINGQVFYDFKKHIGVGADFAWTTGSDRLGTTTDVKLHRFTGLFGPRFNFKHDLHNGDHGLIFHFNALIGFDHDSSKFQSSTISTTSASTAFMISTGANLDVMLKKNFGIRPIDFAYQPTHFGGAWQSNWKLGAGIVFRFGKEK